MTRRDAQAILRAERDELRRLQARAVEMLTAIEAQTARVRIATETLRRLLEQADVNAA